MKRKVWKDVIVVVRVVFKYNYWNFIDVFGLGFFDSEYECVCCKYKWMFILLDMYFCFVYSYILVCMINEGGLRDNIDDKLGFGNWYDVVILCDDFLIKILLIFFKKFWNIFWVRFKSFEVMVGGK